MIKSTLSSACIGRPFIEGVHVHEVAYFCCQARGASPRACERHDLDDFDDFDDSVPIRSDVADHGSRAAFVWHQTGHSHVEVRFD